VGDTISAVPLLLRIRVSYNRIHAGCARKMMQSYSGKLNDALPHVERIPFICRYIEICAPIGSIPAPKARLLVARFQHFDPSRQEMQAGCRYLLRNMLASALPECGASWELSYSTSGAPRLSYDGRPSAVNISFAHSGTWLAVGLSYGDKIGVDIEQVNPRRNGRAIGKFLGWKAGVKDPNDFYTKWTLWEASAKCIEGSALMKQNPGFDKLYGAGDQSQVATSGLWGGMHDCLDGTAFYAIVLKCKEKTALAQRNLLDGNVTQ
jgi:hypothetical protein